MFERVLTSVPLEALWPKAARALIVAIVVEGLALSVTLMLRRKLSRALAGVGGLDGTFRLERRRRVAHYTGVAVRWGLWSIGFLIILEMLGLDTLPVLVVFGAVVLVTVAACWRVLSDVVAGVFLLIDDAFAVGDTVTINGTTGRVEEIASRWLRVLDDRGGSHMIFNSSINQLINHTRAPHHVRAE